MLPNEKHEFSTGWRAAQQNGPVGCTLSWPAEKGRSEGCPFLQPAGPPLSFAQPAKISRFSFGNTTLQLVLSLYNTMKKKRIIQLKNH